MWLIANGGLLTGPLEMNLTFVMPRPKRLKLGGREPYDRKPDLDNMEKAVMDALNERIYVDDSQVCSKTSKKWYAASDEEPHVLVEISHLNRAKGA
jgi:crossover junction endodeoxyribonuclease RusA